MGLLAAILRRNAGGGAEHVRPSLIDSAFTLMNHQLLGMLATGQPPAKLGSGAPSAAPYGVFRAADGEIMIATASEPQFPRLCAALGLEQLPADPRFATMADRIANREPLDRAIAEVIANQGVGHWLSHLGSAGISCGRVNDLAEAWALPVVAERELLDAMQLRLPIDLSGQSSRKCPPQLGEHSREILLEAGFEAEEIGKLEF
jgi:crotonobetainyl-CoA:carnitine CoA-transferase CaiB-like acyl-CoA transferase